MSREVEFDTSGLSSSSQRAYLADLADIRSWCATNQIASLEQFTALDAFAYLVEQRRQGRAQGTLRRRRTILRKLIAQRLIAVSASELSELDDRLRDATGVTTTVLVVSDDAIIRAGLCAVLTESNAACWTARSDALSLRAGHFWDYVVIWINVRHGLDPYGPVRHINGLEPALTTQTPIVAVHTGRLSPMVLLRLAEAGVRYAVPHSWLSHHLHELGGMLEGASVPIQFHLDTALAMRQRLGLLLSGSLAELARAARDVPDVVWTGHLPQSHLPISRAEVNRLRRVAYESSGVPGPDFSRYATSWRRRPGTPEWPRVREVVRQMFELTS